MNENNNSKHEQSSLVLYKYSNPYIDNRTLDCRTFILGSNQVTIHQEVQRERDLHRNTGTIIWDASVILSEFIQAYLELTGKSCLELGSGCGLVSIAAWLKGGEVVATDLEQHLDLLKRNICANAHLQCSEKENRGSIKALGLEWGQENKVLDRCGIDYIFGSEIIYLKEVHECLLDTLECFSTKNTLIYLSYYPRGLGEDEFIEKARLRGFLIHQIPEKVIREEFRGRGYRILKMRRC